MIEEIDDLKDLKHNTNAEELNDICDECKQEG